MFKTNNDLRKEYYREWQKYLKHKRNVYSQIDDKSLDANMVSEANWILRNKYVSCESFGVNAKTGDICFIDFGQAYVNETGYQHFGLIMSFCKNKALVIPMTSNTVQYQKAFDDDKLEGKIHLLRIGKIPGLSKPSVLFMNDMKYINSSRIIDIKAHINTNSSLFRLIQQRMLKIMFNDTN
ncbi:MAG: hypothetical protein GX675_00185 [Erysipelotrichaceae bacterium]|nr:hypothetical protein [Erysipelotrichaceae bacterium]